MTPDEMTACESIARGLQQMSRGLQQISSALHYLVKQQVQRNANGETAAQVTAPKRPAE